MISLFLPHAVLFRVKERTEKGLKMMLEASAQAKKPARRCARSAFGAGRRKGTFQTKASLRSLWAICADGDQWHARRHW